MLMAKLDLSQAEFLFHSAALSGAALHVHQFSGRESLSHPFEFQIDLVCTDANLDLEAPIGQPACLTLRGRLFDGTRYNRYIHGVLERFGAGRDQHRLLRRAAGRERIDALGELEHADDGGDDHLESSSSDGVHFASTCVFRLKLKK